MLDKITSYCIVRALLTRDQRAKCARISLRITVQYRGIVGNIPMNEREVSEKITIYLPDFRGITIVDDPHLFRVQLSEYTRNQLSR